MNQLSASQRFEWLQGEIQRQFDTLSPHLQRIAEYALADPDRFALQTVAQTAGEIGVQPSSLVRFAKWFDFSGFTELQQVYRARLTETADKFRDQVNEHRAALRESDAGDPKTMLNTFADSSILAINQMRHELAADKLRQAVNMLERARFIHVLGQRQAFPVAACLTQGLTKLGCRCQLLDTMAGMLPQQVASLGELDLLVVIGLSDYSRAQLETVPEAHRRGVPVLAISNSPSDPLARNSSLNLMVRDPQIHRVEPLAPYVVLAQTLLVALASALEARAAPEVANR